MYLAATEAAKQLKQRSRAAILAATGSDKAFAQMKSSKASWHNQ